MPTWSATCIADADAKVELFWDRCRCRPGRLRAAARGKSAALKLSRSLSPLAVKNSPCAGIDLPGVIYSREALALKELPASLAVLGGGVIALEMASIFASFGVAVTVIQRSILLRREDREMVRRLTPYLRRQGIKIMTEAPLQRIESNGDYLQVVINTARGEAGVIAERVLVAVGRRPSTGALDLSAAGIAGSGNGIAVSKTMETSVPGIYAVGDVAVPGYFLAHTAAHQGMVAAENAAGRSALFDDHAIPACIFTYPELARVGLTEEEARARGNPVKVGKFPFSANGKAFPGRG